jgi:hypothetical protein
MDKAAEMKNSKVFNMIVLGGLLKIAPVVSTKGVEKALKKTLPERHHHLIPLNMQAIEEGGKIIEQQLSYRARTLFIIYIMSSVTVVVHKRERPHFFLYKIAVFPSFWP